MSSTRRSRKPLVLVVLMMLALLVALVWVLREMAIPAWLDLDDPPPSIITLHLAINPNITTYAVPPDFQGIAMEAGNLCRFDALAASDPALPQLFSNLGVGTIRVGGNTLDTVTWAPKGDAPSCASAGTTLTPEALDQFFSFAQQVGWKVTWGLTLKQFDPATYTAEGAYVLRHWSSDILSMEFGNEPDLYGIPYQTFLTEWQAYYHALHKLDPDVVMSGPGTTGPAWLPAFLEDAGKHLAFLTSHYYIVCANNIPAPTIASLLSPQSINDEATRFDSIATIAQGAHLPYVINESNNYCGGGMPGVSNVFASALWGADYLFTGLEQGAARINFHGIPNDANANSPAHLNYYSPINSDGSVAPIYYAMLLFHYAASSGGSVVPATFGAGGSDDTTTTPTITQAITPTNNASFANANVSAHSILGSDGRLRVILINKDLKHTVTVQINTTRAYSGAIAAWLRAPGIGATSGVTFGGSQVSADGGWIPTNIQPVAVTGANSSITLPAGSAVVVTYQA